MRHLSLHQVSLFTLFTALHAVSILPGATVIDEWDMNENGMWQHSNNGLNLGSHYKNDPAEQQFQQVRDDGTFFFGPTSSSGFGGKFDLSNYADLTQGVVSIIISFTAIDWSAQPIGNNKLGLRLLDQTGTHFVSLAIEHSSYADKIFAHAHTSDSLGEIDLKGGRLVNGLAEDAGKRSVRLEIDYDLSEIRLYASGWNWIPESQDGNPEFTAKVDFAAAGMNNVAKFQTYHQNWGTGEFITMDEIVVEFEPYPGVPGGS